MSLCSIVWRDCRKWYILLLMISSFVSLSDSSSGPSTLIGIVGRDYVLLGADTTHSGNGGIAVMSSDIDKIYKISDGPTHQMLAAVAVDLTKDQVLTAKGMGKVADEVKAVCGDVGR